MPTILFVDQALSFGGSIVVLGSLIEGLDKEKFRPVVVGEMDESILNYHMQGHAKIYVMSRLFNYVRWEKVTGLAKRIKPRLLHKSIIYLLSASRSFVNILYIARFAKIILKEKVDLVHVNNGMSNLEPMIAALLLKRKFIIHFHGIETLGFDQKFLLGKVYKYITISEFLRSALIKNGFPKENMIVIPNPVKKTHALSTGRRDLRSQYSIDKDDRVFGIVGRIVRWKGHIEFLNAAFLVLENVPRAKALIVGDFSDGSEDYQERIQKMVDKSGFNDRIIMTGYIEEVSEIYSIMDVCVHTSIKPEPFGLVIIEAMANGVPVIASDTGAPREIITNEVNGFIVRPTKTTELADTIIGLLTNAELREGIGSRGRANVEKNYNVKDYARLVEQVYQEALDESV